MEETNLKDLTVKELKNMVKELGGSGYSKMKEDELIAYIKELKNDTETKTETDEDVVKFKKIIKGVYGFNGREFRGSIVELSKEEANSKKIKRALELNILQKM